ncbi:MAG: hypothetical protein COB93_08915 [Sneathiella sp.]|nr:MAG: hypothetical protein COB93_08915 [Sneathiella sp.]
MPLSTDDLDDVRRRIFHMFMDSIETIRAIRENGDLLFGERAPLITSAIDEYLEDFIYNPNGSGEIHPEAAIFEASREKLQKGGFYGSQLNLKEEQLTQANQDLRENLNQGILGLIRNPFKRFIAHLNNFLFSLIAVAGIGEALKELKDSLVDELPDDEE